MLTLGWGSRPGPHFILQLLRFTPYLCAGNMTHPCRMLAVLLCLFVAATNSARACGSHDNGHAVMFHHQSAEPLAKPGAQVKHQLLSCCENEANTSCSGEEEDGQCHCPGCGITCHASSVVAYVEYSFALPSCGDNEVKRQAFYFAEHLPEAVYLPIWQPPQLAV